MTAVTLSALRGDRTPAPAPVSVGMDTIGGFETLQRVAKVFATSTIVPKQFQNNLPDCIIAVDMALRMGANPLMVAQNLYVVHGRPAWSAKFLIATLNQCGRFSALRYEFQGVEGSDDWGCRAVVTELSTGEKLEGPLITIGLAKREGWYSKNGSKWQTMPELMLRYRSAAWFVNAYAPEIAMGLRTAEEEYDSVVDLSADEAGGYAVRTDEIRRPEKKKRAKPEPVDVQPEPAPEPETTDASEWRIPVAPLEGGVGSDWEKWVSEFRADLERIDNPDDLAALCRANQAGMTGLQAAYPKMMEELSKATYATHQRLEGS